MSGLFASVTKYISNTFFALVGVALFALTSTSGLVSANSDMADIFDTAVDIKLPIESQVVKTDLPIEVMGQDDITALALANALEEARRLKAQVATLESKLGATEDMLMSSRAAVRSWNRKAVALEDELDHAQSQIGNLARSNSDLLNDKDRLKSDLTELRAVNLQQGDALRVEKRSNENQSAALDKLGLDNTRLSRDLAEVKVAKAAQRKENAELKLENSKLEAQFASIVDTLAAKDMDLELKDGEVTSLSNRVSALSSGLKQAINLSQQLESLLRSKHMSMTSAIEYSVASPAASKL
ncbi:MAG: hypothetical protein ACPGVN_04815 [Alphaproteobacteria bacterium]